MKDPELFNVCITERIIEIAGKDDKDKPLYRLTAHFLKFLKEKLIDFSLEYPDKTAQDVLHGTLILTVLKVCGKGGGMTTQGIHQRADLAMRILRATFKQRGKTQ